MIDSIVVTLVKIAQVQFDEPDLQFDASTPFDEIEEWDSLNHMRMVVAMEQEFQIQFEQGELQDLQIVSDLVQIILRKRGI